MVGDMDHFSSHQIQLLEDVARQFPVGIRVRNHRQCGEVVDAYRDYNPLYGKRYLFHGGALLSQDTYNNRRVYVFIAIRWDSTGTVGSQFPANIEIIG